LLSSIPVAMLQWQVGVPGAIVVATCLVSGLSVVHWAAMRRSEAVWFCDLEEQVSLNELKARWRREERELLGDDAFPASPGSGSRQSTVGRKRGHVYF
jgi:hypothetical protein